jgi:hypothetical protein
MTEPMPDDVGVVALRRLVDDAAEARFDLSPGDRSLVAPGETVVAGTPIAERLRDARLSDVAVSASISPRPGGRVPGGELLFDWRGRWRVATGELVQPLESPVALARYMRILTPNFVWRYPNKIINIHPSILPAFPGAFAYIQAYERGAKIVDVPHIL